MKRKQGFRAWAIGAAGVLSLAGLASTANAGEAVLFVAPARPSVLQVMQDVVRERPGNLLVSYQAGTTPEEPVLYAWNGIDWIYVPMDDFRRGGFLRQPPQRALVLGPDDVLPDALVTATERWIPVVLSVPDLDNASILNAAGRLLAFTPSEWRWFARRYRLDLTDANEPLRRETWFDQSHEPRRFEAPPVPVPPRRRVQGTERPRVQTAPAPAPAPVQPPPRAAPPPVAPEPEIEPVPEPALPRPSRAAPAPAEGAVDPAPEREPGIK